LFSQISSRISHSPASSVQIGCTAKSHPTAVTILPVQCNFVVQPSLIPQQSLCGKLSAAVLYRQDSSQSTHYTARSVQLSCTAKTHPIAITIPPVQFRSVVQPFLIPQHSLYRMISAAHLNRKVSSHSIHYTASLVQLCCTAKSYPTAVALLPVQCSSVVQTSLIP